MHIEAAKKLVIKAGLILLESGLIARTWGNVSCRIDDSSFVITPSGRNYTTLAPDDIVTVNIIDCSYKGDIKPSSEKGIHAEVYKLYPEINFIIHTHQENASIIGASVLDSIKINDGSSVLGNEVICAAYALPGTKMLKNNVIKALNSTKGKAVIMKNHGALCIGKDYDEAFLASSELEKSCYNFIIRQYFDLSGKEILDPYEISCFAISLGNNVSEEMKFNTYKDYCSSNRINNGFVLYCDNERKTETYSHRIECSMSEKAEIHNAIYKEFKDINYIIFKTSPEINAISRSGIGLRPVLDDFAQIAGILVRNVDAIPMKITRALKSTSVVFLKSGGALCCGKTKEDAAALSMVTHKNCIAYIGASLFGEVKPINTLECIIMRYNYLNKYSKQALEKPKRGR